MSVLPWILLGLALAVAALAAVSARRARAEASQAPLPPPEVSEPSEERAEALFAALPVAAVQVGPEGVITGTNPAAVGSFPFLRPGLGVLEAFGDHLLAGRVREALDTGEALRFELRLFVDGRRTFRVVVAPFEVRGCREALITLADTSEATAYQELRSQFVANVSHELRTPLTGLRGMLEALEDPEMPPALRDDFVRRSRSEADRLEALITDILFLSDLEAAQGGFTGELSDIGAVAPVVVGGLAGEAGEQGVSLSVDAPEGLWTPLTDRMAHMVVRNLVENAVRYAGPGAIAVVRARRVGDCVEVEVADDGLGIPEKDVPHIFERFYRADPSRSRRLGGTGLGLSIVKHIAERLGGEASITSREGFGTTVRVVVPSAEPPEAGVIGDAGADCDAR